MAFNYLKEKFSNLAAKTGKVFDIEKSFNSALGKVWQLAVKGKILIPRVNFM